MIHTGRFAPSPSGELHLGSVVAAVGSYLKAKSAHGRWLVRFENLDYPRCHDELIPVISADLSSIGLIPDEPPLIQSADTAPYARAVTSLLKRNLAFICTCSRARLKLQPCTCYAAAADRVSAPGSVRFKPPVIASSFTDELYGEVRVPPSAAFAVLRRSDGLYAYNLACVLDDINSGVTEVVRGADLIGMTPLQNALREALGAAGPLEYVHLPLITGQSGAKLSKQNHAEAVFRRYPPLNILLTALTALGQSTAYVPSLLSRAEKRGSSGTGLCQELLAEAVKRFELKQIPRGSISHERLLPVLTAPL